MFDFLPVQCFCSWSLIIVRMGHVLYMPSLVFLDPYIYITELVSVDILFFNASIEYQTSVSLNTTV